MFACMDGNLSVVEVGSHLRRNLYDVLVSMQFLMFFET